jgi:membrane associated rhomboid family serine protease
MFGSVFENLWGQKNFLIYYIICGLGAAFTQQIAQLVELTQLTNPYEIARVINTPTIGASGAIYGLLLAYGMFFPNNTIFIYFLFPIKAKYFVTLLAVIELYMGISNNPGDNVAHFAHLGGALAGFITIKYWQRKH